jgi:uncharacterized protein (DUF362 family)
MVAATAVLDQLKTQRRGVDRRTMLKAGAATLAGASNLLASQFEVTCGRSADPFDATQRALLASSDWASIPVTGRVVVIKPNLVGKARADTGTVTDPEVVRCIVDQVLVRGARFIVIVEAGANGANFDECGYGFFRTYDTSGRVHLLDLQDTPSALVPLNGWIYRGIFSHPVVMDRGFFFINVAKLKTHGETLVTLGTKNMFGMPDITRYISSPPGGRFAMHDRGVNQAILDNFTLRPPDFTVIDGVIGMEGLGPWQGSPIRCDTVLASRNCLAADRVALYAMGIGQNSVRHLIYAGLRGFGPGSLAGIKLSGDPPAPKRFQLPPRLPVSFDPAAISPATLIPGAGRTVSIQVKYYEGCDRLIEILQVFDNSLQTNLIRMLVPLSPRTAGTEGFTWDGRTESGDYAAPGRYAVHVRAFHPSRSTLPADATTWVTVGA